LKFHLKQSSLSSSGFEITLIEENVGGCIVEYVGEPIEEEASFIGLVIGAL